MLRLPHTPTLFPYTTLFRSDLGAHLETGTDRFGERVGRFDRHIDRLVISLSLVGVKNQGHFRQTADRKSTRLNSSHMSISYAVFCLKKKKQKLETICVLCII